MVLFLHFMLILTFQFDKLLVLCYCKSMLHLNPEEIQVEITNPIKLGSTIENKDFLLDVDVILNHYTRINLEIRQLMS